MRLICLLTALLLFGCDQTSSQRRDIAVTSLTCEYKNDPVGISIQAPRLGWQLRSEERNQFQSAYRIIVADDPDLLRSGKGNIWDSEKVNSDQSILVKYAGLPLISGNKYYWKVKVWDKEGRESDWSEISAWQMGLLTEDDWKGAQWIAYEEMADSLRLVPGLHQSDDGKSLNNQGLKAVQRPVVPLFRKSFNVSKKIKSANLYITGLGQYEASLNGEKTGEGFLTPGWTDYDKTILYNTYDVSKILKKGENALGVIVGNGFYNINRERYRKIIIAYGMPKMIARLHIKYNDGSEENIVSDKSWKTSPSPIVYTSIYGGEDYDARLEQKGWDSPGFSDKEWKSVLTVKPPLGKLTAESDYQLAVKESIGVKNVFQLPATIETLKPDTLKPVESAGSFLYDFGQNASGIIELKVKGKKGQEIRLIPSELINEKKLANQKASGYPYYFSYILKGDGIETWRPRFTYYGFRYVQVERYTKERRNDYTTARRNEGVKTVVQSPSREVVQSSSREVVESGREVVESSLPVIVSLEMLHTRNSSPEVGSFSSSNELFNRINALIRWAIRSNFQSVLTDCPHREKLGWLEQTFLMGEGIHFNYDLFHLYSKQVRDMMEAQTEDGLVPDIAPEYVEFKEGFRDSPEWGSASVILPWMVYKWYGDKSLMEEAWPMMLKYADYLNSKSKNHIVSHGLGDWFDYGPERPGPAQLTPRALTATAIYFYDVKLLAEMAGILGRKEEQASLSDWADEVKQAFNKEFFNSKTNVYSTGSQTAMSMPLCVGLVDEELKEKVVANLVDSIKVNNKALTAGDVGFHYLVRALTEGGASQLLFEMNNRDDVPGYGFQLKKGATALTESWPALEEVSNNHLMLGHIMEWFYTGVGGITQEENSTACKEIIIQPDIVGDITEASTSYHSPYGLISCHWQKKDGTLKLTIEIPVNASAKVILPVKEISKIKENGENIAGRKDFQIVSARQGESAIKVGSGKYTFEVMISIP